jgi:hypothetical protein
MSSFPSRAPSNSPTVSIFAMASIRSLLTYYHTTQPVLDFAVLARKSQLYRVTQGFGGHRPFRTNISKNEAKSSSICDDTISKITELSLSQAHAATAANPDPHSPGVAIVDPDFLHAGKVVLDWLEEERDAFAILDIDT